MTKEEFLAARHELGYSQAEMAEALQVDVRTIKRWESGDRAVSGPVVVALAYMVAEAWAEKAKKRIRKTE